MEFRACGEHDFRATWRHVFSFLVCSRSATLFFMNLDRDWIRLFSFSLFHSFFGRRYDSALWEQALLFRLSASWRFGALPTGMDHSPPDQLNKTLFQSNYF